MPAPSYTDTQTLMIPAPLSLVTVPEITPPTALFTTFPSSMNEFDVLPAKPGGPVTVTEVVTVLPVTIAGVTEFPIYTLPSGDVISPPAFRRKGPMRPVSAPVKTP